MTPDIHTLAGAYVLDAIEPDERASFETHLSQCDSCRQEVAALRRAAASLGESLATAPPPELRTRVLALAERTPQLPPSVRDLPSAAPRRRRTTRWLAAAAAVVAFAAGGVAVQQALEDHPPAAVTAAEVFSSSDAQTRTIAIRGGQARIAMSRELGLIAFDASDMPTLPGGRTYQLWVIDDTGPHSAGVVDRPSLTLAIPAPDAQVALTTEPAGGSAQPTTEPLFTVEPSDL
jgi:anti-sigma-K factor RskA